LQHVLLLTDGVPNMNPPRGIIEMLKRMKQKGAGARLPCTVNTFGFGYALDSELLDQIAGLGSGSYAFIPDAGFVGTVFVNAVTNLLVTMATNVTLTLEPLSGAALASSEAVAAGLPAKAVGNTVQVELQSLQFGQSKDVLLRLLAPTEGTEAAALRVTVQYCTRMGVDPMQVVVSSELKALSAPSAAASAQRCRVLFVDGVGKAMAMLKQSKLDKLQEKPLQLPEAQEHIKQLVQTISAAASAGSEALPALLEDLSGQ
ncbi:unnamed protein product, partial [Polarella glacialis]